MKRQETLSSHTVIASAISVQRKPSAPPTQIAPCHHCVWLLGKPSTSLPALHSVCSHRNSSHLDSLQLSSERKGKLFSSSREKGGKRKKRKKNKKAEIIFLWHTMTHRFGNEGCESFLFSLFFSGLTADKSHSSETSDRTGWSKFIFHLPIMILKWGVTELFLLCLNTAVFPFPSFVCCCLELGKTGFLPAYSLLPRFRAASVCPCTCSLQLRAASAETICTRPSSRLLGPLWLCLNSFPCHIFLAALAISALVHCSSR